MDVYCLASYKYCSPTTPNQDIFKKTRKRNRKNYGITLRFFNIHHEIIRVITT